jgi:hypothetical protein
VGSKPAVDRIETLIGITLPASWTYDRQYFQTAASLVVSQGFAEFMAQMREDMGHTAAHLRLLEGEGAVHVADLTATEVYSSGDPARREKGSSRAAMPRGPERPRRRRDHSKRLARNELSDFSRLW